MPDDEVGRVAGDRLGAPAPVPDLAIGSHEIDAIGQALDRGPEELVY
jgi:hypothetical protein